MVAEQGGRSLRTLRRSIPAVALMLLVIVLGGAVAGCSAVASAPDVSELHWNSSTVIYDRNGEEVYRVHAGENRTPVELEAIPRHVVDAFVAIEDPNFYAHKGIDARGLARAVVRSSLYLLHLPGGRLEGGSTITQQLARDGWLSQEVSLKRKLQEAWVAIQLERTYTKDEILEMYLNQIYFGHGAYGIDAAARTFFGKEVGELTVAEGAQLAGMINGPSIFNPYADAEASIQRRNLVLEAMLERGKIDQATYEAALAEEPQYRNTKEVSSDRAEAGHFTDYVISILEDVQPGLAEKYNLELGSVESVGQAGLKVYTTLDPKLQRLAEEAVRQQMAQADQDYGLASREVRPEAAMVVMNPRTGEVLAMVGGRDHETMLELNLATTLRQPGSAIKPIVAYLPALEAGLSPATILDDAPYMVQNGTVWPQNYDFKYQGLKPMRYGVEQSVNPMAVRALMAAGGPAKGVEFAHRFGLTTIGKQDEHLALALGGITDGVSVLDMTAAYSAVANLGVKVDPVVITRIEDRHGNLLFEAHPRKSVAVRPETAYLMIDMMKDVIRKGTAYGFTGGFRGWPAAGKTGTTENNRDGWFVGFTPDLVATVWTGYADGEHTLPWTGAFVPVKVWNQFMTQAVTERPADWVRPPGVVEVKVCRRTGMLPGKVCPRGEIVTELFVRGTEPRSEGTMLVKAKAVQVRVTTPDKSNSWVEWRLWQRGCKGRPVERLFIRRPEPRVQHPTDPWNPKYVPADVVDELPTKVCQPVSLWERLLDQLPILPGGGQPGSGDDAGGNSSPGNWPEKPKKNR